MTTRIAFSLTAAALLTLLIGCSKPSYHPHIHGNAEQFTLDPYMNGYINSFLDRYAARSPDNSLGSWDKGPYNFDDSYGRISIQVSGFRAFSDISFTWNAKGNTTLYTFSVSSGPHGLIPNSKILHLSDNIKTESCSILESILERIYNHIYFIYHRDNHLVTNPTQNQKYSHPNRAPNPSFNSDPAVTGCVLKQFPWVLRSR